MSRTKYHAATKKFAPRLALPYTPHLRRRPGEAEVARLANANAMSRLKSSSKEWTQGEKAYGTIKRAILRGEIPQGVFLSEAEITRQYGTGRTPYRKACNRLHHDRLLEAVPRRGYLVPEISFHAARDLFEA